MESTKKKNKERKKKEGEEEEAQQAGGSGRFSQRFSEPPAWLWAAKALLGQAIRWWQPLFR